MDTYVSVFVLIFLRLSVSPFQSSYACLCKSFVNFCTCFNLCEFICFILWVYFVRICFLFLYLFFKSLCICFCSFMFQFESENVNQSYTWQTLSFRTKSFEIGFQISLGRTIFFLSNYFFFHSNYLFWSNYFWVSLSFIVYFWQWRWKNVICQADWVRIFKRIVLNINRVLK